LRRNQVDTQSRNINFSQNRFRNFQCDFHRAGAAENQAEGKQTSSPELNDEMEELVFVTETELPKHLDGMNDYRKLKSQLA
jgi:hypothetical protein